MIIKPVLQPLSRVPVRLRGEVGGVLITKVQLARRVKELAREIERDFQGRDLVVVSLLNGTVMFLADLIRHLNLPLRLDFMGVSSYRGDVVAGVVLYEGAAVGCPRARGVVGR